MSSDFPRSSPPCSPATTPISTGPGRRLHEEVNAEDLDVIEGAIPTDIDGVYLRNTENQIHQPLGRYHPFDGDGMIHQIAFQDGRASYRNRFVRTRGFEAEQEARRLALGRPGRSGHPGEAPGLRRARLAEGLLQHRRGRPRRQGAFHLLPVRRGLSPRPADPGDGGRRRPGFPSTASPPTPRSTRPRAS